MEFKELQIGETLIKGLEALGITKPTKIQELAIPEIMKGEEILLRSETGSGKTLAYLLPMFEKYKELEQANRVIILVPTHELAMQVHRQAEKLSVSSGISFSSAVIMGNVNIKRQIERLRDKPQLVIGTPGRILELIKKKKIAAHLVKTIIIDEADKLLDQNNRTLVTDVVKCAMRDCQLVFSSASMPDKILTFLKSMKKELKVIQTQDSEAIPANISHFYFVVEHRDKLDTLRKIARSMKAKRAMVFINSAWDIEEAAQKLCFHGWNAAFIHGTVSKEERKKAIESFQKKMLPYLISTDLGARGLHFEDVEVVFHISIPEDFRDYLHRAGRTGRNDKKGLNILIVTKEELSLLKEYEKKLKIQLICKKLYQGKIVKG